MASERVHILLCTRDGARWLPSQLESLRRQTHPDWVLWVSDDSSTDGTERILQDFAARNPGRVAAILKGPDQGSAANFLSLLCHPDLPEGYVALCDQDDVWLPHKLEHALARLVPFAVQPCGWSGRFEVTDAALRPLHVPPPWPKCPSLGNAVVQNIMSGHTLTLNPAALALIRQAGPVCVPHHDWWIYLVLMACEAEAIIDPEIVLQYRQHARNAVGSHARTRAHASRFLALVSGELHGWIMTNLDVLAQVGLPLSAQARYLLDTREQAQRFALQHLLRRCGLHRQHWLETAALALVMPQLRV